jgi:hypothetical protein
MDVRVDYDEGAADALMALHGSNSSTKSHSASKTPSVDSPSNYNNSTATVSGNGIVNKRPASPVSPNTNKKSRPAGMANRPSSRTVIEVLNTPSIDSPLSKMGGNPMDSVKADKDDQEEGLKRDGEQPDDTEAVRAEAVVHRDGDKDVGAAENEQRAEEEVVSRGDGSQQQGGTIPANVESLPMINPTETGEKAAVQPEEERSVESRAATDTAIGTGTSTQAIKGGPPVTDGPSSLPPVVAESAQAEGLAKVQPVGDVASDAPKQVEDKMEDDASGVKEDGEVAEPVKA